MNENLFVYVCVCSPFLFIFDTRLLLFYATSFDRDRAMQRFQDTSHDQMLPEGAERITPKLERKKVRAHA